MQIWQYLILFFSGILGGLLALPLQQHRARLLQWGLSLSGSYLLGITVLHLMPGVFSHASHWVNLLVLAGFFIQLLLEQLSKGVEHGHIHAHQHASSRFALQVMIGLCLHAFLEGLPLSSYPEFYHHFHEDSTAGEANHLLFGIVLHKAPAAFALVTLLTESGYRSRIIYLFLIIFSAASPVAALIAQVQHLDLEWLTGLMALVVGSFLHISTTILFEADDRRQHRISWKKLIAISLGLGLAFSTMHG